MATTYDKRTGQFRGTDGKFVSRAKILQLLDAESARLQVRLQGHARLLTQNRIAIAEFQTRLAHDLKLSALRSAAFGAGGEKQLTSRHFGSVGQELKRQYGFLHGFGQDLAAGKLSAKQAMARAKSYGISTKTAFFQAEKITRRSNNFNVAKRSLGGNSKHCLQCLQHSTQGRWIPIEDVVPIGVSCQCGGNCLCRLTYKRVSLAAMASLA